MTNDQVAGNIANETSECSEATSVSHPLATEPAELGLHTEEQILAWAEAHHGAQGVGPGPVSNRSPSRQARRGGLNLARPGISRTTGPFVAQRIMPPAVVADAAKPALRR